MHSSWIITTESPPKSFSVIRSVTTFNGTTSVHYSDVWRVYETHRGNWRDIDGETTSFGSLVRATHRRPVVKVRHFLRAFGVTKELVQAA